MIWLMVVIALASGFAAWRFRAFKDRRYGRRLAQQHRVRLLAMRAELVNKLSAFEHEIAMDGTKDPESVGDAVAAEIQRIDKRLIALEWVQAHRVSSHAAGNSLGHDPNHSAE
ncbi:MAG: hypothetical protein VX589_13445 [Myxococcota bacterium]|nr:hypothetical protein [Myxococcota bacterium]